MLGNFFSTFKTGRASETINGRAAQMGFLAAAYSELTTGTSLREQLFVTRNIDTALVHKTINYPQAGFFMALATVVLVTAGSLPPALKGKNPNGLDEVPEDLAFFKASSEVANSRWAMVGLAALWGIEGITGGALLSFGQ